VHDTASDACVTLESELALLTEELRKLTMGSSIRATRTDKGGREKDGQGAGVCLTGHFVLVGKPEMSPFLTLG